MPHWGPGYAWQRRQLTEQYRVFIIIFGATLASMDWGSIRNQKFQLPLGVIEVAAVALVNYGLTIGDAILITPIASALSIVTITLAVIS